MRDCPNCDCEPGNHCLLCGGTGFIPDYESQAEPPDDYADEWDVCESNWSPN